MLASLLIASVLTVAPPAPTGPVGYRMGLESRVEAAPRNETLGSPHRWTADSTRRYHLRLTYTWKGLEKLCTEGRQILEGDVYEEVDEDGRGFVGVLSLTARYVTCGEAAIGNRACLASVNILGEARFVGSLETEVSGIDSEGRTIGPGDIVFNWRPIDERTKVNISGNCPRGDASEKLKAQPDYEIYLHFRPPPDGQHRRFVLLSSENSGGAGILLDVWTGRREVVAIPRAASPVARGQALTLDGSASKGADLRYEWSFMAKHCPPGATGHRNAKKMGRTAAVILLCSSDITLTVTEGGLTDSRTDTKTISVSVIPRNWKTPFEHTNDVARLPVDAIPSTRPIAIRDSDPSRDRLAFQAGHNQCLEDPGAKIDHTLHPLPSEASWEGIGYDLDQIKDRGGPFDGYWYLSAYKLRVRRQTALSPYLLPGGPPPVQDGASFYTTNKAAKKNVDGYLAALLAHEGMWNRKGILGHSGRMRKQLEKADPARVLEAMFSPADRKALRDKADAEILRGDEALCDASKDPLPVIWNGEILFPNGGSGEYTAWQVSVGGPHSGDSPCD